MRSKRITEANPAVSGECLPVPRDFCAFLEKRPERNPSDQLPDQLKRKSSGQLPDRPGERGRRKLFFRYFRGETPLALLNAFPK